MENDTKQLIRDFIDKQKLAVISTVTSQGNPEAAVIEFAETDDLELVFTTFSTYRKYKNLQHNKRVALVIGWDEKITVQYEGDAYELSKDEQEKYKEIYFMKNPKAKKWEERKEVRYFKVIPTWIRYSDLSVNPWKIQETSFMSNEVK
jgi:pyridoxine/pyridoxamine 5'-phosphate oxidase